jgi:hypothetical protein
MHLPKPTVGGSHLLFFGTFDATRTGMEQQDKEKVLAHRRKDSQRAADMIYEGGSVSSGDPHSADSENSEGDPRPAPSIDPIDPSAHLPRLMNVAKMAPEARHAALAHWVAWFNGHRNEVSPELEIELTQALEAMDRILSSSDDPKEIQRSFDEWLSSLPAESIEP